MTLRNADKAKILGGEQDRAFEAGDLEIDDTTRAQNAGSSDAGGAQGGSQSSGPTGNIRRTGDR